MDRVLNSSLMVGIAAGLGMVLSYGLGFVERFAKQLLAIPDPQPRPGFWLSLCRWLGIIFVASVSHSHTNPVINDGQLQLAEFLTIGLVGGLAIVISRLVFKWRWRVNEPRWFILLDSCYMMMWSLTTALVTFCAALFIGNRTINYILPTFLMFLQINGVMRAFVQTAEQRKLRANEKLNMGQ